VGEQDRVLKIGSSILTVLMLVVAGLDVGRYHWTGPVGPRLPIAALVIVVLGYLFMAWATLTNRFFSSAVRLQTDRGQVVVDSGPYRLVRHPGYAGAIRYLAFGGLALGSWLATLIAAHDCDSAAPHAA
jgi:protein-S-isoprenylcysteine O-methyltransferase Ste14